MTQISDLTAQVSALTSRRESARLARARADHALEVAQEQQRAAQEALRTEFGVTDVDTARAELVKLETQFADAVAALTTELDRVEGRQP